MPQELLESNSGILMPCCFLLRFSVKALRKPVKIVNKFGAINISGEYGSIDIDEKDFVLTDGKGPTN